jgi:hypothetical protein
MREILLKMVGKKVCIYFRSGHYAVGQLQVEWVDGSASRFYISGNGENYINPEAVDCIKVEEE